MEHLQCLYSTAVGIALSAGLYSMLQDGISKGFHTRLETFLAFLITLVPFYHGALVHLDRTYLQQEYKSTGDINKWHLFAFVALFIESCLLVSIGFMVSAPCSTFATFIAILLGADIFWALVTHIGRHVADPAHNCELIWALINFAAFIVLLPGILLCRHYGVSDGYLAISLLIGSTIRTWCDYRYCWPLYYGTHWKTEGTTHIETK